MCVGFSRFNSVGPAVVCPNVRKNAFATRLLVRNFAFAMPVCGFPVALGAKSAPHCVLVLASPSWSGFGVPFSHCIVGTTWSPAWHRNERAAPRRARLAVRRGVATEVQRKRLTSHHGSCLPGAMTAALRVEARRVSALDLGWVKMLASWKQWSCGIEKSNPRRHCKSGLCHQGRPHCDATTSRESAKEHECWDTGSCKG